MATTFPSCRSTLSTLIESRPKIKECPTMSEAGQETTTTQMMCKSPDTWRSSPKTRATKMPPRTWQGPPKGASDKIMKSIFLKSILQLKMPRLWLTTSSQRLLWSSKTLTRSKELLPSLTGKLMEENTVLLLLTPNSASNKSHQTCLKILISGILTTQTSPNSQSKLTHRYVHWHGITKFKIA